MIFNGLFLGIAGAALYLLTRRLLPAGLIGGMVFGAGLLVLLGTTLEPLRDDNPDFDLVGPGWLAVLVFSGLALAYGIALAVFTARLSGWLPLLSTAPRVLVRYAWPAVVAIAGTVVTAALAATGVAVVAATRWDRLLCLVRSPRAVLIGRVVLGAAVLAALPGALEQHRRHREPLKPARPAQLRGVGLRTRAGRRGPRCPRPRGAPHPTRGAPPPG